MPNVNFSRKLNDKSSSVIVSSNFLKLGKINTELLNLYLNNLKIELIERKKQLIAKQFVKYPTKSKKLVISRSGAFLKSIQIKGSSVGKLGFNILTYYDRKYQTVQPSDDSPTVTIRAKDKKFLAIPNENNKKLFNADGSYKYAGIPLYEDGEPNPFHPLAEELEIRPRNRKDRTTNKQLRLVDHNGKIYYFLKRFVTIKTKRPITKADKELFKGIDEINEKAWNKAVASFFDRTDKPIDIRKAKK